MTTPRRACPPNRAYYFLQEGAQLDEDRTLCSHALCCAGCHAPSGEYRRLFGLHDIFARHRRHRHARIGVGQHHQHWRCPGGLSFSPRRLRLPVSVVRTGGVLPDMVPMAPCTSDFAGSGALARRVIVRWADGDNPMLVGVSQTSYVSLTLLVPSRRAVSYQRILPCFGDFFVYFRVIRGAQLLRRYYQRTGGPGGGGR
jgi:hypothetical protein